MAKLGCFIVSLIAALLLWFVPILGPLLAALAFLSANTIGMAIAAWVDRNRPDPVYFQKPELTPEDYEQIMNRVNRRSRGGSVKIIQIDARSITMNNFHDDRKQHEPKHVSAEVKP